MAAMLPKEHGAYGLLACPLITALALASWTLPAVLTAVAAIAGFLAHEPLLVLLGRRGTRMRRDAGPRAMQWLVATGTLAIAAGVAALWLAPAPVRWSFLLPLAPGAALFAALWADREKTTGGEIAAATAFSFVVIPVCLSGGTTLPVALSIGIAFAALSSISTLGVRVVILKVRGGGDVHGVRSTRRLVLALTALVTIALVSAASYAVLPWATILAITPTLALATLLAINPPAPTALRRVGWMLVSTSSIAVVTLIVMLAGAR